MTPYHCHRGSVTPDNCSFCKDEMKAKKEISMELIKDAEKLDIRVEGVFEDITKESDGTKTYRVLPRFKFYIEGFINET